MCTQLLVYMFSSVFLKKTPSHNYPTFLHYIDGQKEEPAE